MSEERLAALRAQSEDVKAELDELTAELDICENELDAVLDREGQSADSIIAELERLCDRNGIDFERLLIDKMYEVGTAQFPKGCLPPKELTIQRMGKAKLARYARAAMRGKGMQGERFDRNINQKHRYAKVHYESLDDIHSGKDNPLDYFHLNHDVAHAILEKLPPGDYTPLVHLLEEHGRSHDAVACSDETHQRGFSQARWPQAERERDCCRDQETRHIRG